MNLDLWLLHFRARFAVVVPRPRSNDASAPTKAGRETRTPTTPRAGLRNVPASVGGAVDSGGEQAEAGKQNKRMTKWPLDIAFTE